MHSKALVCGSVILMLLMFSIAFVNGEDDDTEATTVADTLCEGVSCETNTEASEVTEVTDSAAPTTMVQTTAEPATMVQTTAEPATMVQTTAEPAATTRRSRKPQESNKKKRRRGNRRGDNSDKTGKSPLESINVWVAFGDGWESYDQSGYQGGQVVNFRDKEKYSKDTDYEDESEDNDSKKIKQEKKRKLIRIRFPVRHYPNRRRFPARRFPTLMSISPWLPIFFDKSTYQTIIFSPTGGYYILPPLINFYGQRFSVAQLIKWGYASLVSSGTPPPPNVDVAPFVQPQQPATQYFGSPNARSGPLFDENRAQFTNDVKTNFVYVKPRYSDTIDA
ncbi:unnamed protein product [Rotaria socialis]|uniref:Uncharacterized protein n=1 Tax=Rotaria socialis TaxID=392032 RepID=A0A820JSX6_9BILA|nr:unnamed protein product [Rotaria socialis]CAF3388444.1 unnamed protein product [Rotaria socialis]CAF3422471.1 unnamed protein product [Rotaria socialis]CAF3782302.1 unnamed protein product [Rotaria socialis]CAF4178572.1 unnamed protein product [Rotaria socialis]